MSVTSGCSLVEEPECCCCPDETPFEVVSDWHDSPKASPEGMAYMFFPISGNGEPWRFDFPGKEGGSVPLPDGSFHVMVFNDDTSRVQLCDDQNYSEFFFCCRNAGLYDGVYSMPDSPVGPVVTDSGEPVKMTPDHIWGESVELMALEDNGVRVTRKTGENPMSYSERILVVFPHDLTPRYSYTVSGVSNLEGVARMCASLSGMASRYQLSLGLPAGDAVTFPVGMSRNGNTSLSGGFYTFGRLPGADERNFLTLYFWLKDGRKFKYEFDVTTQIVAAPDPMDVMIRIDGVELPESGPGEADGAFDVSVDGWDTYIIDIPD